jgi:hypothetical protein
VSTVSGKEAPSGVPGCWIVWAAAVLSAGVGFWLAELSCVFSMSLEILLWVKTDEIERNVTVSAHQKAADDNRQLNVAKTQLP